MIAIWKFLQQRFLKVAIEPFAKITVFPGQKAWECNLVTGEIVPACVELKSYDNYFIGHTFHNEVVVKKNCIYDFAINGENAVKKFEKRILKSHGKK